MPRLTAVVAHGAIAAKYLNSVSTPLNVRRIQMKHFRLLGFKDVDALAAELHL